MIKQVILLGGHIQALGLARQAKGLGLSVILFIEDIYSVARFSQSVNRTVVFGSMERLGDNLKPFQNTDSLLFPTGDQYVEYIADNYETLSRSFVIGIPQIENVELFGNKRKTYQFASEMGIPHPQSWYPNNLDDINVIAEKAKFPLVVKPAVMYSFHSLFGKKAFRCDNKNELLDRCNAILQKMPLSSIVIQEFLSGGPKTLYSFGSFSVQGEPKAWIVANRIRQNPMDFGNSTTFAISSKIPEVEATARRILCETRYTGLAEIEFMYDESTKEYKFLEINTRAWKWHSISTGLGFGFLSELIKYLNGQPGDFEESPTSVAWVERLTDLTIIFKEFLKGKMNIWNALKMYNLNKVNAVWSWRDPLPGIMYLILSPLLYFKRY